MGKEKEEKESDGQRSGVNMTVEQGNVPRYQLYFFFGDSVPYLPLSS